MLVFMDLNQLVIIAKAEECELSVFFSIQETRKPWDVSIHNDWNRKDAKEWRGNYDSLDEGISDIINQYRAKAERKL